MTTLEEHNRNAERREKAVAKLNATLTNLTLAQGRVDKAKRALQEVSKGAAKARGEAYEAEKKDYHQKLAKLNAEHEAKLNEIRDNYEKELNKVKAELGTAQSEAAKAMKTYEAALAKMQKLLPPSEDQMLGDGIIEAFDIESESELEGEVASEAEAG